MPRGISRCTSDRASRLSATGTCSSGTRYSPGSCPWKRSDDEPAAPLDLHDRLAGTELIDPRAHHLLGALDGIGAVGDGALRLVDFEGQMNTALQIEAEVDGHATDRGVLHATGRRVAYPL